MAQPFDVTTKELVELNPPDWLSFLQLPPAPVSLTDADLATLSFESDKVLRVDDPNGVYLVHIEFQASFDATFDLRVLRYHVLLSERHRLPVISVGILLRPGAAGAGTTGHIGWVSPQRRNALEFTYELVRVWEIPPEPFLEAGLALLPLAPLAQVSVSELPGVIGKIKARLAQNVPPAQVAKLWTSVYLLMGLQYEDALVDRILEGVRDMKESVTYQKILREGREEGRIKEAHTLILRLGEKRFGTPSAADRAILEAMADIEQLEDLSLRLLEVESWSELLAPPDAIS